MQNAPRWAFCNTSTFITLPFAIKTFVLYFFEWPLKTSFTVLPTILKHLGQHKRVWYLSVYHICSKTCFNANADRYTWARGLNFSLRLPLHSYSEYARRVDPGKTVRPSSAELSLLSNRISASFCILVHLYIIHVQSTLNNSECQGVLEFIQIIGSSKLTVFGFILALRWSNEIVHEQ